MWCLLVNKGKKTIDVLRKKNNRKENTKLGNYAQTFSRNKNRKRLNQKVPNIQFL